MREHKYRAWDRRRKVMVYIDDFYWFEENYYHNQESDGGWDLMESTGLRDKAGREIYEGDIVDLWAIYDPTDEEKEKWPHYGVVEWDSQDASFFVKGMGEITMDLTVWFQRPPWDEMSVCGNRIENPGLLTPPEGREG